VRRLHFIKHLPITTLNGLKFGLLDLNISRLSNESFFSPEEIKSMPMYASLNKGFRVKRGKRLNISGFSLII
jgi:hypothetical protein